MGELFECKEPSTALEWTGERLTSAAKGQVEVEHLHRYFLARELCRGLEVLDVACGEGYGTALIGQTARSAVGVDVSVETVDHARAHHAAGNVTFLLGDARSIPIPDASVDAVVSFETIEHFYEHDAFVAEVRRVLRPGGLFIVSSPDRDVYAPTGTTANPYHVRELSRLEFENLLHRTFSNIVMLGQRPLLGSALMADASTDANRSVLTFESRGCNRFEASNGLARPTYRLAVASDKPLPSVYDSLFIANSCIDESLVELPRLRSELRSMRSELDVAGRYGRKLEAELKQREAALEALLGTAAADREALVKSVADLNEADQSKRQYLEAELKKVTTSIAEMAQAVQMAMGEREDKLLAEIKAAQALGADTARRFEAATAERDRLASSLATAERAAEKLRDERDSQAIRLEEEVRKAEVACSERDAVIASLADASRRAAAARAECAASVEALAKARLDSQRLEHVLSSTSWRLTQPLRELRPFQHPGLRKFLRSSARITWRVVSFQFHPRLFEIIRQRRIANAFRVRTSASHPGSSEGAASGREHLPEKLEKNQISAPPGPPAPRASEATATDAIGASQAADIKSAFTIAAKTELHEFLQSNARISFPEVATPEISVVIVTWHQAHFTLGCLRALIRQRAELTCPSFEVVLIDNKSTDETDALLARLDGVRIIRNPENLGFPRACNQGAAASRGRVLLMLNNDANLRPRALAAALDALDGSPKVGAVGGRIIFLSGLLQEAGSIIWSDGNALGYGRNLPPEVGEVMFRRDVDFCSAAFLLTPRKLWNELGGFDEGYSPAYYEDADYCMRVWENGYRVVYEPGAALDHFENGSEVKSGNSRAFMLKNRERFVARHRQALQRDHLPPASMNVLAARSRRGQRSRSVLVLDNEVPIGSLGSGYPRMREILVAASELGWATTFFPLHQRQINWAEARTEVSGLVEIVSDRAHPEFSSFVDERRGSFDVLIVSRPDNMRIVRAIMAVHPHLLDGVRLIYDAEALYSGREIAQAAVNGRTIDPAVAEAMIADEVRLADCADAVVCVNDGEAEAFRRRISAPVHILSHSIKVRADAPDFVNRNGFLFVGRLLEKEAPNWIGLMWFLDKVWPLIRARLPSAKLAIVGRLHPENGELNRPGVQLRGPIDDLGPIYDEARVFIAPIRFAAGVPIKILEAFAAGVPTVATALMVQQLGWTSGPAILGSDDPASFAAASVDLHEEETVWSPVRAAAQRAVIRDHSEQVFRDRLKAILEAG